MEFIFNELPSEVKTQLEFIQAQLILDGPTGIMVTMMANKGVNIPNRILDCDASNVLEVNYNNNEGLAKGKVSDGNKLKKVVVSHARKIAGNGKSVLPTMNDLGGYGYIIIDGTRVKIPVKEVDIQSLMVALKLKVDSFTLPPCPLTPYITGQQYVLATDIINIGKTILYKTQAAQMRQANKGITRTIAVTMEPSEINLRDFAAVIQEVSPDDPSLAAKYGFKTRNTSTVLKDQLSKILPTGFKTIKDISKLTSLVNKTGSDLWVRKGKKRTGAYVILPANGVLLVRYGYGTCTIENPSTTTPASVTATVNRKAVAA